MYIYVFEICTILLGLIFDMQVLLNFANDFTSVILMKIFANVLQSFHILNIF